MPSIVVKSLPRMLLYMLLQGTTGNYRLTIPVYLPSPKVSISLINPQGRVDIPLKAYKLDPSYDHNFFFLIPIF